ncbi:ParA family protein [Deinococcus roseus]|uniref:Chromosome partitioning protein ParA n=1 Tax=Deinococcus roseus TaxID=392414 RepID=A0ABQ2D5K9_9DEIO|nr:ParA family protein [Deinococcus roseus]GGJ44452.1 chromosome partitioning protein ParA [Deinococcus roseus]
MKFISVAGIKGGVGKTTTAVSIAKILADLNHSVLLIDSDVGLSASYKWLHRNPDYPWGLQVRKWEEVRRQLEQNPKHLQEQGLDYVVMDTRGSEDIEELVTLARQSTLMVLPTKPDGLSVEGLKDTLTPLLQHKVRNFKVLITDSPAHNSDGKDAQDELVAAKLPVFASIIRRTEAVSKAATQGVPIKDARVYKTLKDDNGEYKVDSEGYLIQKSSGRAHNAVNAWLDYQRVVQELVQQLNQTAAHG